MSSYGTWLSAAGMKINELRQSVNANNLANAQTTGFKHDFAVVAQRVVESREDVGGMRFAHPVLDGLSGGVNVLPVHHTFEQGTIEHTGRPLDVAVQGEGFFAVQSGETTRYTRDGEFTLNAAGELVLEAGEGKWKVLSDAGTPIVAAEGDGAMSIAASGNVVQDGEVIGRLGLVTAANQQLLRKTGENLFDATATEMTPIDAGLVTESREESTYDVMEGLTAMIEATRAYQLNATMIQLQDELTSVAATSLGRLTA